MRYKSPRTQSDPRRCRDYLGEEREHGIPGGKIEVHVRVAVLGAQQRRQAAQCPLQQALLYGLHTEMAAKLTCGEESSRESS